jgi:predicted alpha/beta-fold hydrolase
MRNKTATKFNPPTLLKNAHIQTIFPAIFTKVKDFTIKKEIFELEDGDFVECIWHNKPNTNTNRTIIVLFHGLAGSFKSHYIQRAMKKFSDVGYSVVLMHFRGCSGLANRLPRSYHSGDTADAKSWISHLQREFPKNSIVCVGYSLGANMLLKLLGEYKDNSPISLAVAVSAPMKLSSSADAINKGISKIYQYYLMRALKKQLLEKYDKHNMNSLIALKREDIPKLKTFWEFDEAYTAPIHGFKNAKDYYNKSSSKQFLKYITTKTLIIHSKDDPFMCEKVIPDKNELSNSIELELYPDGGHVGFITGDIFNIEYWLEDRILEFIKNISQPLEELRNI